MWNLALILIDDVGRMNKSRRHYTNTHKIIRINRSTISQNGSITMTNLKFIYTTISLKL